MTDWTDNLTPEEQEEWERFTHHARTVTLKRMTESSMVVSMFPSNGKPDPKYAVELGYAILLGKPILILAMPGTVIPPKLEEIADMIVTEDLDTEEGKLAIATALKVFAEMYGKDKS